MVKIIFKTTDEKEYLVNAKVGDTLLESAKKNGVPLFGACDGAGVCGSCHVRIDENDLSKLNQVEDLEQNMLDLLPNGLLNSRLACQVIVSEKMDGMTIMIP